MESTEQVSLKEFERRFIKDGKLTTIPKKQGMREALRRYIAAQFTPGTSYSEKEVNEVIAEIYSDYAYLRRELVDYGLMARSERGDSYHLTARAETP